MGYSLCTLGDTHSQPRRVTEPLTIRSSTVLSYMPEPMSAPVPSNNSRAQRAEAGQKGFHESALLPKAGPSFAQLWTGHEGRKGHVFKKLSGKRRKQRHPAPRYGGGHDVPVRLRKHLKEPKQCRKCRSRCRKDLAKVHCLPKLDRRSLSFGQCRKCGKVQVFQKNLSEDTK